MAPSFLDLPTEMRLKVYSHFAAEKSHDIPLGSSTSLQSNDIVSANRDLLMTCKTVRYEALPEFFQMANEYYRAYEAAWQHVWKEGITIASSDRLGHVTVTYEMITPLAEEDTLIYGPGLPLIYNSMDSVTYMIPTRTNPIYGGPVFKLMVLKRYLEDVKSDKIASVVHVQWDWIDLSDECAKQWLKYEEDWNQMWTAGETNGTIALQLDATKQRIKGVTWTHKPQKQEKD
jgi:hypothetical protein